MSSVVSGQPFIDELYDFRPHRLPKIEPVELVVKYTDKRGCKKVKGSQFLKGSQSYTKQ